MQIEKVPIDMSSEQKEILGIVSKRQLSYVVVGGLILYAYVPFIFNLFSVFGWVTAGVISLISATPTVLIIFLLGFTRVEKHYMNRDFYYIVKFQKKTQYGSWRK